MKAIHSNNFGLIEVKGSIVCLCAVLGVSSSHFAAADATQKDVVIEATATLGQLVVKAHEGELTPEQLRAQRIRVERKMNQSMADAPIAVHPKELAQVDKCRTDLNQQIIRSHEYEFFGPNDCPAWGWYPSRQIQSEGSALRIDNAGKATMVSAKPQD